MKILNVNWMKIRRTSEKDMTEILESLTLEKNNLESLFEKEKTITTQLKSQNNTLKQQMEAELHGMLDIQQHFINELQHLEGLLTKTENEKFQLENMLQDSEKHNEFFGKLKDTYDPQSISDQRLQYEETENQLKGEIQQLKEHNDNLQAEIDTLKNFKEEVNADNFDSRQITASLEDQLDQLKKEDKDLENLISDLRTQLNKKKTKTK